MGQVSPLPPPRDGVAADIAPTPSRPASPVRMIASTRCALCGTHLEEGGQRFSVVSPQSVDRPLTVCHTCRNAALSEGYRPAG
jgi:hypothetical protein